MNSPLITLLADATTFRVLGFLALVTAALGVYGDGAVMQGLFLAVLVLFSALVSYRITIMPSMIDEAEPVVVVKAEDKRPDLFPATITPDTRPLVTFTDPAVPANLPVVGYANTASDSVVDTAQHDAEMARALETQAHQAHVLLSTDALRHFIATVPPGQDPASLMASVIMTARDRYPSEDGWVVISEARMREVCVRCLASAVPASNTEPYVPTVIPEGAGSLAEMIALGNLGAAFALIGHRPMFALADAVADFDAVYRARRDSSVAVSDLLRQATASTSDETVKAVISALTSALDGTYTDEAEAVKTAIMKAIKAHG
jgi:hypothetical protein